MSSLLGWGCGLWVPLVKAFYSKRCHKEISIYLYSVTGEKPNWDQGYTCVLSFLNIWGKLVNRMRLQLKTENTWELNCAHLNILHLGVPSIFTLISCTPFCLFSFLFSCHCIHGYYVLYIRSIHPIPVLLLSWQKVNIPFLVSSVIPLTHQTVQENR